MLTHSSHVWPVRSCLYLITFPVTYSNRFEESVSQVKSMLVFSAFDLVNLFVSTQLLMLLPTSTSLQPRATPCWSPGSLPEPRSPATSSDMRNLAHQPRRSCLAPGPAPPRLPSLVTLFCLGALDLNCKGEGGGRPNYKLC